MNTYAYPFKRAPFARDLLAYIEALSDEQFNEIIGNVHMKEQVVTPIEHVVLTMPMTEENIALLPPDVRF
jgi:hypothetical protein